MASHERLQEFDRVLKGFGGFHRFRFKGFGLERVLSVVEGSRFRNFESSSKAPKGFRTSPLNPIH